MKKQFILHLFLLITILEVALSTVADCAQPSKQNSLTNLPIKEGSVLSGTAVCGGKDTYISILLNKIMELDTPNLYITDNLINIRYSEVDFYYNSKFTLLSKGNNLEIVVNGQQRKILYPESNTDALKPPRIKGIFSLKTQSNFKIETIDRPFKNNKLYPCVFSLTEDTNNDNFKPIKAKYLSQHTITSKPDNQSQIKKDTAFQGSFYWPDYHLEGRWDYHIKFNEINGETIQATFDFRTFNADGRYTGAGEVDLEGTVDLSSNTIIFTKKLETRGIRLRDEILPLPSTCSFDPSTNVLTINSDSFKGIPRNHPFITEANLVEKEFQSFMPSLEVSDDIKSLATADGLYLNLNQKIFCEEPERIENGFNNGLIERRTLCNQNAGKGYAVWVKPYWYIWSDRDENVRVQKEEEHKEKVEYEEAITFRDQELNRFNVNWIQTKLLEKYPYHTDFFECIKEVDAKYGQKVKKNDYQTCIAQFNKHAEFVKASEHKEAIKKLQSQELATLESETESLKLAQDLTPSQVREIAEKAGANFLKSVKIKGFQADIYNTERINEGLPVGIAVFVKTGLWKKHLAVFAYTIGPNMDGKAVGELVKEGGGVGAIALAGLTNNTLIIDLKKKIGDFDKDVSAEDAVRALEGLLDGFHLKPIWTRDNGKTKVLVTGPNDSPLFSGYANNYLIEYRNVELYKVIEKKLK